jgi:hypothetical protein
MVGAGISGTKLSLFCEITDYFEWLSRAGDLTL